MNLVFRSEYKKSDIIESLKKFKALNKIKYDQALIEYHKQVLEKSKYFNDRFLAGKFDKMPQLNFGLVTPVDVSDVYEKHIETISMTQKDTIELDAPTASNIFHDSWQELNHAKSITASYTRL